MKYLLLLLITPLLLGCTCSKKTDKKAQPIKKSITTFNHKMKNVTSAITGKIEVFGQTNAYLVEKWTSRSRASYRILGTKKAEIAKMPGKIIIATGELSKTSRYSGTINITEYKIK